ALTAQSVATLDAFTKESSGLYSTAKPFWISNQVLFSGATFALVEKLASTPSLLEVREQLVLPLPTVTRASANSSGVGLLANEWGVTKIGAPSVWATGNTAQNV
ncbi:hypothetical protein PybrP1_004651, partial [[Pythium] brassicae (nom. inval.)]